MLDRIKNFVAAGAIALAAFLSLHGDAVSQGFPNSCQLLNGAQPQQSCDYSNPPLTFGPQGYVGGSNGAIESVPIGSVAYASFGTSTTYGASGTVYVTSIYVPADTKITNINFLAGAGIGVNSVIGSLYNSAGTLIANSLLTGTVTANANTFQTLALTTPIAVQGPSVYYVGISANGTTDSLRTVAASTFIGRRAGTITGNAFGTLPAITVPTTFTALTGPIVFLN